MPNDLPFSRDADLFEHENLLHGDDVAFHAGDLRDTGHFARAVAETRLLNDDLNRGGDLVAHGALGKVDSAHPDHRFHARQRVARRVGMDGRQRPVVTRIHRLEHVERFLAADLAHDDAIGSHTQRIDDKLALAHGALAFDVRRSRLEPRHVLLTQLQFRRVLDGDDALVFRDEARTAR